MNPTNAPPLFDPLAGGPIEIVEDRPSHPIIAGYVAWCFGIFGAHRFYYGKPVSGLIYLLTMGLLFIGWIVDAFTIASMSAEAGRRYATGRCDYTIGWILLAFLGVFGVHRFYMQKFGTGLIFLLTGGLLGIGVIYDVATLNEQIDAINRRS